MRRTGHRQVRLVRPAPLRHRIGVTRRRAIQSLPLTWLPTKGLPTPRFNPIHREMQLLVPGGHPLQPRPDVQKVVATEVETYNRLSPPYYEPIESHLRLAEL